LLAVMLLALTAVAITVPNFVRSGVVLLVVYAVGDVVGCVAAG